MAFVILLSCDDRLAVNADLLKGILVAAKGVIVDLAACRDCHLLKGEAVMECLLIDLLKAVGQNNIFKACAAEEGGRSNVLDAFGQNDALKGRAMCKGAALDALQCDGQDDLAQIGAARKCAGSNALNAVGNGEGCASVDGHTQEALAILCAEGAAQLAVVSAAFAHLDVTQLPAAGEGILADLDYRCGDRNAFKLGAGGKGLIADDLKAVGQGDLAQNSALTECTVGDLLYAAGQIYTLKRCVLGKCADADDLGAGRNIISLGCEGSGIVAEQRHDMVEQYAVLKLEHGVVIGKLIASELIAGTNAVVYAVIDGRGQLDSLELGAAVKGIDEDGDNALGKLDMLEVGQAVKGKSADIDDLVSIKLGGYGQENCIALIRGNAGTAVGIELIAVGCVCFTHIFYILRRYLFFKLTI